MSEDVPPEVEEKEPAAPEHNVQDKPAESAADGVDEQKPEEQSAEPVDAEGEKLQEEGAQEKEPENKTPEKEGVVTFQRKVEIHFSSPMPQYNVGSNKAYKAVAKDKNRTPLIALVCERHLIPRLNGAKTYQKIINPNAANLVLHGPVYWEPAKQERYVFIYLDNLGKPLLTTDQPQALGWKQDDAMEIIVKPMINILLDFKDKDFAHGGIRPTNMYDAGASGKPNKIILGDCLSAPCSFMQPALYETIERAMADPIARGTGTQADDMYALGVSLTVCLRSSDPLKDLEPDELIRQKLQLGSYAAVTGKDRFKGEILELLRGLLHDDPGQRWTVEEVQEWMDGLRLSPKQALIRKKAARPIAFGTEKYLLLSVLAMNIESNPTEVRRIVEDDSLHQWLKRSVEDEETIERVDKSLAASKQAGTGAGYDERLVTYMSSALDPMAPIRYKHFRFAGDGVGSAMAEAVVLKQDMKVFADLLGMGLMLDWLSMSENPNIDVNALFNKFEQSRRMVRNQKLGEGIERCLYLLCAESPCLSEALKSYYVTSPYDMLRAFEDLCSKKQAPSSFLDRHVVAFLMQRDSRVVESFLFELNSGEKHKITLANLKCMAAIQKYYDGDKVPAMSAHFAANLASVYESYHDKKVREKIKKAIDSVSDGGDLQKMAAILDNMDLVSKDEKAFKAAIGEFAGLEKEKDELEKKLADQENFGVETGREMAAIVSSVFAAIVILGVAFMFFTNTSLF